MYYILKHANIPVSVRTLHEKHLWETQFPEKVVVKQETIKDSYVSTVFIGNNNTFWETIVVGGDYDGIIKKHLTYKEALDFHNTISEKVLIDQYPLITSRIFFKIKTFFKKMTNKK
jgi:hypothetical protein